MSRAIGVVTVARSVDGHLTPLLQALHAAPDVELLVYIAGSHLAARFGRTASLVEADGWDVVARVDMDIDDDAPGAIAAATGRGVTGFAREFARRTPDVLVVLGDRYEMLSAAVAALPFALPVAHLHGGEVTEGAIDEQIRHAITKLAHLHFPAAEPYAERVRQLGEEAWRVHCCGAPGLDRLHAQATMSREALAERLELGLGHPTMLVTFHPETLAAADVPRQVGELAAALEGLPGDLVITAPGADTAHRAVTTALQALAVRRALDPGSRKSLAGLVNPYGDGHAAPRIARVLQEVELGPRLVRKRFVDAPR